MARRMGDISCRPCVQCMHLPPRIPAPMTAYSHGAGWIVVFVGLSHWPEVLQLVEAHLTLRQSSVPKYCSDIIDLLLISPTSNIERFLVQTLLLLPIAIGPSNAIVPEQYWKWGLGDRTLSTERTWRQSSHTPCHLLGHIRHMAYSRSHNWCLR
jgi:hypothetical protein